MAYRGVTLMMNISQFIESLICPHVTDTELALAYQQMAQDEVREGEDLEWVEALMEDVADEAR